MVAATKVAWRIAHVTATFPPYRGGTGNVCYYNARELVRRGHDVTVFTAAVDGAPERETQDGIHIRRLQPLVRVGNGPVLPQLRPAFAASTSSICTTPSMAARSRPWRPG